MHNLPNENFALFTSGRWKLLLDRNSLVDQNIIRFGAWEAEQMAFLFGLLKPFAAKGDAIFLDIGAYFGVYSLFAAESGMFSEIHAFEADRHNFEQLRGNVSLNGLEHQIKLHPVVLSDHAGRLYFQESQNFPDNRGHAGVTTRPCRRAVSLECAPLDARVTFKDKIILIKLDVEGHEPQVLKGMQTLLRDNKIILQAEAFEQTQERLYATAKELGLTYLKTIQIDHYFTNFDLAAPVRE